MEQKRDSIKKRIQYMQAVIFIPIIIMIGILLYIMAWQNGQYRQSIRNLTLATEFNFDFKTNIDYKMYRIVIGTDTFASLLPYEDLERSRQLFVQLRNSTTQETGKKGLDGILRLLDMMEKRIRDIENSNIIGDYDRNMQRLDQDIYIISELIQESMSNYIYRETKNLEEVQQKLNHQIIQLIVLAVILSAFNIIFMILSFKAFAKQITSPIEELCAYTMELAGGKLEANGPKSRLKEVQMLSDQYDQMVIRIGQLIDNIREEQEQKRATELKLLQAQINPHFLYNTLDTIVWLAEGKRHQDVVNMITVLSSFLRIALNKGQDFITIKEEAEHVDSYLQIQHFRYEDILDYEIRIDPEIKDCRTLKLTLQPIVENALYHGIKNRREKGFLQIFGWQEGDKIMLQVKDNGIGMKPDVLAHMQRLVKEGERSDLDRREGFGIANVAERIRLNFGEEYGLQIESEYGVGTIVTVRIPVINQLFPKKINLRKEEPEKP